MPVKIQIQVQGLWLTALPKPSS